MRAIRYALLAIIYDIFVLLSLTTRSQRPETPITGDEVVRGRAKHRHFFAGRSDRGIAPDRALMESGDRGQSNPPGPSVRCRPSPSRHGYSHSSYGNQHCGAAWITKKRALLESIDTDNVAGLCDRALTGVTVYSFGSIGAVSSMAVKNAPTKNRGALGASARARAW
jgi:hypothetical protein